MIDMRMSQQHEIYGRRIEEKWFIVESIDILRSLIHTAIYQNPSILHFQQIAGTGDDFGSSAKS